MRPAGSCKVSVGSVEVVGEGDHSALVDSFLEEIVDKSGSSDHDHYRRQCIYVTNRLK